MEAGEIGARTLGEHVYNEYVSIEETEWDSYRIVVHTWEIENYQSKF
ncbi:hypothetical protein CVD28_19390 [Bacillus sp. M6-12]|nr:hypothetical protein CVD28_19390 [Bacillus sp. M6-12]